MRAVIGPGARFVEFFYTGIPRRRRTDKEKLLDAYRRAGQKVCCSLSDTAPGYLRPRTLIYAVLAARVCFFVGEAGTRAPRVSAQWSRSLFLVSSERGVGGDGGGPSSDHCAADGLARSRAHAACAERLQWLRPKGRTSSFKGVGRLRYREERRALPLPVSALPSGAKVQGEAA